MTFPYISSPGGQVDARTLFLVSLHLYSGRSVKTLVIGLCGGSGSGKTTVTQRLLETLDKKRVLVLQHDSYYKDIGIYGDTSPDEINFDHPDALETDLLVEHVRQLKKGESIEQPVYDFKTHHRLSRTVKLARKEIVILEGILLFVNEQLREVMDLKIFLEEDADERLMRRVRRDMAERGRSLESILHQYSKTVKPMHLEFVESSKRYADIIVPRGAENLVAIDMIGTKIKSLL